MPIASTGRRVAELGEPRDRLSVDRSAQGLAERGQPVGIFRVIEVEADRRRRRRIEEVVMPRVVGDIRFLDIRHELVRRVDVTLHHLEDRRRAAAADDALDAFDVRCALQPVVRIPAKRIPLSVKVPRRSRTGRSRRDASSTRWRRSSSSQRCARAQRAGCSPTRRRQTSSPATLRWIATRWEPTRSDGRHVVSWPISPI